MDGRTDMMKVGGVFCSCFSHISSYSCELNSVLHCSFFMHYKTLYVKRGKVKAKQQPILLRTSVRLILSVYFHQFYFCFATSQDHDMDPTMLQTALWVEQCFKELPLTILVKAAKGWHSELLRSLAGRMRFAGLQSLTSDCCFYNTLNNVSFVINTKDTLLNVLIKIERILKLVTSYFSVCTVHLSLFLFQPTNAQIYIATVSLYMMYAATCFDISMSSQGVLNLWLVKLHKIFKIEAVKITIPKNY